MKNGIYFNLPEDEYFKENRLSSTDIRLILESPSAYWFNSNYNLLKKEKNNDFLKSGKIYHAYILDRENFDKNFKVIPENISNLNKNSKEYKTWCALQDKPLVNYQDFKDMELNAEYLSQPGQLLYNDIFKNGWPEVSIFYEKDGIPCKQRIDYLKLTQFIDLKTYLKSRNGDLNSFVSRYFYAYKVYIQLFWYLEGLKIAKQFDVLEIHGTEKQIDFILEWQAQDVILPIVVFLNRELPQFKLKTFTEIDCPDMYRLAKKQTEKAIEIFKTYQNRQGMYSAWLEDIDTDDITFKDDDFPQSFADILSGGDYE